MVTWRQAYHIEDLLIFIACSCHISPVKLARAAAAAAVMTVVLVVLVVVVEVVAAAAPM